MSPINFSNSGNVIFQFLSFLTRCASSSLHFLKYFVAVLHQKKILNIDMTLLDLILTVEYDVGPGLSLISFSIEFFPVEDYRVIP